MIEHPKTPLLDHGYLQLIESWGSDQSIIEGARMSTDKGFLGWGGSWKCSQELCDWTSGAAVDVPPPGYRRATPCPKCGATEIVAVAGDEKLLAYLWKNKHSTPFELGGLTIEVQAPIFVFREWHRHRIPFGYSELSARYTPMPNLNYVPTLERCMMGGGHLTKQAGSIKGSDVLTDETAMQWLDELAKFYDVAELFYQRGLKMGVPKELARIGIPVGRYSRMRATGNLRGWLAFLALRYEPTAQYEIRVYAEIVARLIAQVFPHTHEIVYGDR